jgi:soluble lytic murein transglycosylase-like protein
MRVLVKPSFTCLLNESDMRQILKFTTVALLTSTALVAADVVDIDAALLRVLTLVDTGQIDEAKKAMSDTALMARAPGLHGTLLVASGRSDDACALARREAARTDVIGAAAARRAIACTAASTTATDETRALFARVLEDPHFGHDPLTLAELLDEGTRHRFDVRPLISARALALAASSSDTSRREAHARVLLALKDDEKARPVTRKLLVELAETRAASDRFQSETPTAWLKALGKDALLARARVLEVRHANEALLSTLQPIAPSADEVSDATCEARFLVGKTERKRRRYQAARTSLDFVSSSCGEPWKKRALYTNARVAAFALTKDAPAVIDAFLAAYPDDALTDDVMVWKAELLMAGKQSKLAEGVYAALVDRFPDGDMALHARFTRAFLVAERGDTASALKLLDDLSRATERASPLERDQAHYWRARLEAFPRLDALTPSSDAAAAARGLAALAALARARPASYYGHLARTIVDEHGGAELRSAVPAPIVRPTRDVLAGMISVESTVASAATHLFGAGFVDEAARLVDAALASSGRASLERATADASLYALVGRADRAHQVMRGAGHALLGGAPSESASTLWALAYPRAHDAAITHAAEGEGIPPTLLMALAREESAFDAAVTSWAGALGLCQLMPPTAREEADRKRLPPPTVESLRAPELNAMLGAAHLARRMKELGHPFFGIAAYNAGPGNVAKWKRYMPIDAWVESIPVEQTRMYVKKVTGSWVAYALLDGSEPPRLPLLLPARKK